MPHSSAITAKILAAPDPRAMRDKICAAARYFMAQDPVTADSTVTDECHYNGRVVVPGPKADPELVATLEETDADTLANKYGITFVDFTTTEGAEQKVANAPYTIMSSSEADDFERQLRAQKGLDVE